MGEYKGHRVVFQIYQPSLLLSRQEGSLRRFILAFTVKKALVLFDEQLIFEMQLKKC